MASTKLAVIIFFVCSLIHRNSAEVICESLPTYLCSFAVSSDGKRCVLENSSNEDGSLDYVCVTSEITVERLYGYIETDQCVNACGVDRGFVGISSDAFLSQEFAVRLCSPACYGNCLNIVDLYFNLAAGEGVSLPAFCQKLKNSGGAVFSILSNGGGAAAAVAGASSPEASPIPAPSLSYL